MTSSNTFQDGHFAALDILQMSGFVNYYGRVNESDNIHVKPVLLQKGTTKLALYGLSNVRDERLFRTFRDGQVTFSKPRVAQGEWYNIMSVHQNHSSHTETGWLPESFLPDWLDLVVWGHEHECQIDPRTNPETGFKVMQPGSSIATSLIAGEAESKQVAILNITGRECKVETIRLKTVRPFVYRDIKLSDDKRMRDVAMKPDNLPQVKKYCKDIIDKMIDEAHRDWLETLRENGAEPDEDTVPPLPIIRLRVEYTAPSGGDFKVEQNQRFSNEYMGKVANVNDVIQFHRKRAATSRKGGNPDMPDEEVLEQMSIDSVKVAELVKEFLTAQSLTILPQNLFSDAVTQFVDKDDKAAMQIFVSDSLSMQVAQMIDGSLDDDFDEEDKMAALMKAIKTQQEERFERGEIKNSKRGAKRKPKPSDWDSDMDGHWFDDPASIIRDDDGNEIGAELADEDEEDATSVASRGASSRGRGRGRGRAGRVAATGTSRATVATKKPPAKKGAAATGARGSKKQQPFDEEDEDDDVIMLDDDDDEETSSNLFVSQASVAPARKAPATTTNSRSAATTKRPAVAGKQTMLSFSSQANGSSARTGNAKAAPAKAPARSRGREPSDDDISDDDAFETPAPSARATRKR